MEKFDYGNMLAVVEELIPAFGTEYALKRSPKTIIVNGVEQTTTPPPVFIMGIRIDYKPTEINGTTILSGDVQVILVPTVKNIIVGDILVIDGLNYRIENPNPIKPADLLLAYKLQLRLKK